jgi:hypothetical protein
MLPKYGLLGLMLVAGSMAVLSRVSEPTQNYQVDKVSPNGDYRVKIELREDKKTGTRDRTERLKIQYFRNDKVVFSHQFDNSAQYEPSLRTGLESVEWVTSNVLRMGRDSSDQPFNDELIVTNSTKETLEYLEVNYGRHESFHVFDMAPKTQIILLASPGFKPDGSSNYSLGFGGKTQSGKTFEGTHRLNPRKSPAEGLLKFDITLKSSDLR